jgi:hypothetical protein
MKGSCLCGEIAYEATGLTFGDWGCSCSNCRKFSGTAFVANSNVLTENFRWIKGKHLLGYFEKIPGTGGPRAFCTRCGSPMPYENEGGFVGLPLGSLDDEPEISLRAFLSPLPAWAASVDVLPTFEGQFPASYYADSWKVIEERYERALSVGDDEYVQDVRSLSRIAQRLPDFHEWWSEVKDEFRDVIRQLFEGNSAS